jgi:SAM-dependent methyltransferase
MLGLVLRDLMRELVRPTKMAVPAHSGRRRMLNVGGGSKSNPIPACFEGWDHLLLDIDPRCTPDIVCDARKLSSLGAAQFDAVYCSHNLEHYYRHDAAKVLAGFLHVLRLDGFAFIMVPDLQAVIGSVVTNGMDLDDILFHSTAGPISVLDVVYGFGREIETSGNDYYAHRSGFTPTLLRRTLENAGFARVFVNCPDSSFEVQAIAFKTEPTAVQRELYGLPAEAPGDAEALTRTA